MPHGGDRARFPVSHCAQMDCGQRVVACRVAVALACLVKHRMYIVTGRAYGCLCRPGPRWLIPQLRVRRQL
jgi:hypothetical protein